MLSWFKKKLGGAQEHRQGQGTESSAVQIQQQASEEPRFFSRLKKGLSRTRKTFVHQLDALFLGKRKIDAELLDELEEILIMADIGANTTQELLEKTREQVKRNELADGQALKAALKEMILGYLRNADRPADLALPTQGPLGVMVLGVNGGGKTTTIG